MHPRLTRSLGEMPRQHVRGKIIKKYLATSKGATRGNKKRVTLVIIKNSKVKKVNSPSPRQKIDLSSVEYP